jgi:hypothetical protein
MSVAVNERDVVMLCFDDFTVFEKDNKYFLDLVLVLDLDLNSSLILRSSDWCEINIHM